MEINRSNSSSPAQPGQILVDPIQTYFANIDSLRREERWDVIISYGKLALEEAERTNQFHVAASISAQLASTLFRKGDFEQARFYAMCFQRASINFDDPSLYLESLYLESAIDRILAQKEELEEKQQELFSQAVTICKEAASIHSERGVEDVYLKGKIHFNLGAAHADNPKGDLEKAKENYGIALNCFKQINAIDDIIRISLRIGKIHLLKGHYDLAQNSVDEARPLITSERVAMHADYLEAQVKLAVGDMQNVFRIARNSLERARALGATEDELRILKFLKEIS